jgi:hypothetical protein
MKPLNRNRPSREPLSALVCAKCRNDFVGADNHVFCAICVQEIADKIDAAQQSDGAPLANAEPPAERTLGQGAKG